jgi:putative phosphoesterase
MKIAVISDIHGNIIALEAVLADIEARGVDFTVNLGDILSGALQPCETAHRLMTLNFSTIKGNHERQVLSGDVNRMGPSDRRAHETISPDQRQWIDSLPTSIKFDDVLLVHGTPASDLEYFLETVTENGCRPATMSEVVSRAGPPDASLILCGHTHLPRSVRLDDERLIVNPGSVGLQAYSDDRPFFHLMETGTPHAKYAIVQKINGNWVSEHISVCYDWENAAAMAEANGRSDWIIPLKQGFIK